MSTHRHAGRRAVLPVLAVALVVLVAAGKPAAPATGPQRRVVVIRGMAFVPSSLTVQQGDTIVWVNEDIVPHTATGLQPAAWTTGTLLHAQRGRVVAREKGVIAYTCDFHPTMKGALTIQ